MARRDPPRRHLDELLTESMIGGYRILLVEGPSDLTHLGAWLSALGIRLAVVAIDSVEVTMPTGIDEWGNCDRLMHAAHGYPNTDVLRFLIDRDTRSDFADEPYSLLITDFPGLESYALCERVLTSTVLFAKRMNLTSEHPDDREREREQIVRDLVTSLSEYLGPLFAIRRLHREERSAIEFPADLRKFRKKLPEVGLDIEKVLTHLKLTTPPEGLQYVERTDSCDVLRPVAYGHDIARSIWSMWPDLRQKTGLKSSDELEDYILSVVIADDVREYALFAQLREWASQPMPAVVGPD